MDATLTVLRLPTANFDIPTTDVYYESYIMAFEPMRSLLHFAVGTTVKSYKIEFDECFGFLGRNKFCSGCSANVLPSTCTQCYTPEYILQGTSCVISCSTSQFEDLEPNGLPICKECGAEITACEECFRNPATTNVECTSCKGQAIAINGGTECQITCPQNMWYNVDYICNNFHPNCTDVANLTGDCLTCENLYILNTTTKRCDPPPCPALHWRVSDLVC